MTALSIWTYPYAEGARRLEQRLADGTAGDVVVMDGALVIWLPGRAAPQVRELQGTARTGSLGIPFWGLLFGIVVAGPELAALAGEQRRALDASLSGVGIDRTVLGDLRRALRPGRSAVAAICSEVASAEIERASRLPSKVPRRQQALPDTLRRRLTDEQDEALRRLFSA